MMTVADKLTRIAENEQKVYEAGHDAGYTEGLNKGGYADGYEEGKKAEYDAFWDAFQNYGKRVDYQGGFYGSGWNDSIFKPKYDINPNNCSQMFVSSKITDLCAALDRCGVTLDTSASARVDSMYYYTNIIKAPTLDTRKSANLDSTFAYASKMESVEKILLKDDGSQRFNNSFVQATALKDITFDGVIGLDINFQHSTKLSADSIRSIIEHLSDTEPPAGQPKKTLTLSRTAVENADFGDAVSIAPGTINGGGDFYSNPIYLNAGDRLKVELTVSNDHFFPTATYDETKYDYYMADPQYWGVSLYNRANGQWSGPDQRSFVHTATGEGSFVIEGYFAQYTIDETTPDAIFSIRAVLVDEDGNEITGENLYSAVEIGGISNIGGWEALRASKKNWTISLA